MKLNKEHIIRVSHGSPKAIEVKSVFWLKNNVFVNHLGSNPVYLERAEIKKDFKENRTEQAIIKTLAWGYPQSMRRFNPTHENISLISQLLPSKGSLSLPELYMAFGSLLQIDGLGPSTVTKLLFFNGSSFENTPCLILDERVIKSIKIFHDFELLREEINPSKLSFYLSYLKRMQVVSKALDVSPEQLEIFLFEQNGVENQQITNLQDTLLPKLISGELEVNRLDRDSLDLPDEKDFK
jgi:hypothetical protein